MGRVMAMKNTNECSDNDDLLLKHGLEMMESILESKSQYRRIIKAGIAQWVRDFQSGEIKVKTVDDLKKLIEMDLALQQDEL